MKKSILVIIIVFLSLGWSGNTSLALNTEQEITYPSRPKTTELREIMNGMDSLAWSVKDLGATVSSDINIPKDTQFFSKMFLFCS